MEFLLRIHCLHFKSDYRESIFVVVKKIVNPGKNLSNNWKQGLRTDSTPVWKKGLGGEGEGRTAERVREECCYYCTNMP